jgi:hypothetical protein
VRNRPAPDLLRGTWLLGMLGVLGALGAVAWLEAADINVKTEHDRSASFEGLRTYAWLPTPPYTNTAAPDSRDSRLVEAELDAPIRAAVDRLLAAKRFSISDTSQPDFTVVYYAAFSVGMNADVLGAHYAYVTGWGAPWVGATPTTSLRVVEQGTLVVDILRRDRKVAIWRGTATGAVDRSRTDAQRLRTIDTAVTKMFAKFPPKR